MNTSNKSIDGDKSAMVLAREALKWWKHLFCAKDFKLFHAIIQQYEEKKITKNTKNAKRVTHYFVHNNNYKLLAFSNKNLITHDRAKNMNVNEENNGRKSINI